MRTRQVSKLRRSRKSGRQSRSRKSGRQSRSRQRGGTLINHLICDKTKGYPLRPDQYEPKKRWFSPAFEYYKMVDLPFEVNEANLSKLQKFKKADNEAFKFIIFDLQQADYRKKKYIYAIHGSNMDNKHPCCFLHAVREHADELHPKYQFLIKAIDAVFQLRQSRLQNDKQPLDVTESTPAIAELNKRIYEMTKCNEVESAGAGTMINDNKICINNKSGHYKATFEDVAPYTKLFAERTGLEVYAEKQATTEAIKNFLKAKQLGFDKDGNQVSDEELKRLISDKSGICMSEFEPAEPRVDTPVSSAPIQEPMATVALGGR